MEDLLYTDWPSFVHWFREAISKEPETKGSENSFLGSPTDVKIITESKRPADWELRVKSFQNLFVEHFPISAQVFNRGNDWIEIWRFELIESSYGWYTNLKFLGVPYERAYTGERYYKRHRPESIIEYIS